MMGNIIIAKIKIDRPPVNHTKTEDEIKKKINKIMVEPNIEIP